MKLITLPDCRSTLCCAAECVVSEYIGGLFSTEASVTLTNTRGDKKKTALACRQCDKLQLVEFCLVYLIP